MPPIAVGGENSAKNMQTFRETSTSRGKNNQAKMIYYATNAIKEVKRAMCACGKHHLLLQHIVVATNAVAAFSSNVSTDDDEVDS